MGSIPYSLWAVERQIVYWARQFRWGLLKINPATNYESVGHSYKPILDKLSLLLAGQNSTSLRALEWGPGENTGIFARYCNLVVSIESNVFWHRQYVARFQNNPQVQLLFIPFPDDPYGIKRYPGERISDRRQKGYVSHPEYYFPDCEFVTQPLREYGHGFFDMIFVDGAGYRRSCLTVAKQLLAEKGCIILHDYPIPEKTRDMPSGESYDDVVSQFKYVKQFPPYRTTVLSNDMIPDIAL